MEHVEPVAQIMPIESEVVLLAEKVTKRFPGTLALDQVDFTVYAGAVNALIGENGAGKSTLMKILAGVEQPSSGRLLLNGSPVEFKSTREAEQAGIGIIYQELNLFPNLSISENIFTAHELTQHGVVQHGAQAKATHDLLNRLEQNMEPSTLVRDLRIGQQQVVEIAKAISRNVRILIMDEPTSALTAAETEALFGSSRTSRRTAWRLFTSLISWRKYSRSAIISRSCAMENSPHKPLHGKRVSRGSLRK